MAYTIEDIKIKTIPIAKAYGISRMSLFGSYAKGTATNSSDIDIYVDKGRMRSLLQYFSFVNELEDALKCHVDVVTTGIEDKEFLNAIQREGIILYEE